DGGGRPAPSRRRVRRPLDGARARGDLRGASGSRPESPGCHAGVAAWRAPGEKLDSITWRGGGLGMAEVVALQGLRKTFHGHLGIGRTVAVDGLDLSVRSGEIFGLLGPNGAGKTTTLKMMLGLLRPDRGSVRLFG